VKLVLFNIFVELFQRVAILAPWHYCVRLDNGEVINVKQCDKPEYTMGRWVDGLMGQ